MNPPFLFRVLSLAIFIAAWPWATHAQTDPVAPEPAAAPAANEDGYLRGYVDALLETRFAGLRLWVERATVDGKVSLTGETCLGVSQRHEVEQRLADTGLVRAVHWDPATDCERQTERAAVPMPAPREVRALPERELFAPLVADPRQPRFSMSYQYYRAPGQRFDAAAVALGEYFGLAEGLSRGRGSSQVGIEAAVFALFNLDAASKDLVNADYRIAVPLSYRRGPWSYQFSLLHQSSHLGDEFILGNPGVDRVNLSYEAARLLVSHEWERWRVYGGGDYLLHSDPDLERNTLQGGVEYRLPHAWRKFDFVAGLDVKSSEELDWKASYSVLAGLEFRRVGVRRLRLMLEYFDGHSPNGQFYRERLSYTGLGLYFGF